jgi:Uma2 family endonuclease
MSATPTLPRMTADEFTLKVTHPLVVMEVLSRSSAARDTVAKFTGYFRLPSLRHYLIVAGHLRTIIHRQRDEAGVIQTRIVHDSTLTLDPPGIEVRGFFD